ncbi:MAG: hypothetical protein QOI20_2497 [Acidimicrobiaceae bacterium]|jgi:hypothetical protein|nr:hypothetical protein [Acidimicrobiaceae bacterium]
MTEPHDLPSAAELVEAVREFLAHDVLPAVDGRVQFHTRVAVTVLGMVERELALGPAQAAAHSEGLAALGVSSEAELARIIRQGGADDRMPDIGRFVRATVRAKLEVANPKYLAE